MTASASNLIRALNLGSVELTRAVVAGADSAMLEGFISGSNGIDGSSSANYFENAGTSVVTDDWYSAWAAFSGAATYDMSAVDRAFVCHYKVGSAGFNNIKAVRFCLRSGPGTANWGIWEYTVDSVGNNGFYHPFMMVGSPDSTVGTFDNTDVTGFAFMAQPSNTDVFAFAQYVDQLVFIDGPVNFEDTGTAATVEMQDYFDLVRSSSAQDYRTQLAIKAGPAFEFGFPFRITSDDYSSTAAAEVFAFKEADSIGFPAMASGYYQMIFEPQASGSQVYSNLTAATNSTAYDLTLDGSNTGATLEFNSCLFAGLNDVVVGGANTDMVACSISSPATCDISDGDLNITINSPATPVTVTDNFAAGSSINITSPVGDSLQFDAPAGDFSGVTFTIPASTVNINGAGSYDLSGIESAGSVEFDNLTASAATVTVSGDLTATVASPTTGGGSITIDTPVFAPTVTLTGLQNPTEVRIYTAGTQTELAGQEVVTTGTYSVQLPVGTSSIDISILSLGYKNARILALSTTQDVNIPISQELDRQYLNP